jgi:hypothetical protein
LFFLARRHKRADEKDRASSLRSGLLSVGVILSLGLVFSGAHAAEAAQVPGADVDIVTPCEFIELSNVVVETDSGGAAMPSSTYDVLTATITNNSSFPADVFINTKVTSDPENLAAYTTLSAFEDDDRIYRKGLNDASTDDPTRLQAGESITVRFRATVAPNATNAQQAARVIYDVVVTAIQAT